MSDALSLDPVLLADGLTVFAPFALCALMVCAGGLVSDLAYASCVATCHCALACLTEQAGDSVLGPYSIIWLDVMD